MKQASTTLIRAWFLEHDNDGEFLAGPRSFPYALIGSPPHCGSIIITTKPMVVSVALQELGPPTSLGMIGRYGLPDDSDLSWIRKLIAHHSLLFLGDMDPVDLLVFAWFRASLHPQDIVHLGINDAFLRTLQIGSTETLLSPCTAAERSSLDLLKEVFPDLEATIGTKCMASLERGEKLELDGILGGGNRAAALRSVFLPTIDAGDISHDTD